MKQNKWQMTNNLKISLMRTIYAYKIQMFIKQNCQRHINQQEPGFDYLSLPFFVHTIHVHEGLIWMVN